ncbi:MAG: putative secreted protein [Pseudomonas sp.]|nr:putative secreted protein [Pseudomonas sp.]
MFKYLVIGALSFAAFAAQADESKSTEAVTAYTYGMKLDIAKVVSQTQAAEINGVVPVLLTYQDSRGAKHTVEYSVMSEGTPG